MRDYSRISGSINYLNLVNAGSTAIGTGISQKPEYLEKVVQELRRLTNFELKNSSNLIDATRNTDAFAFLGANLKIMALNLSKNCNDLRLLSSGPLSGFGEFILPAIQPGSSIMPGKINPVIPEVVNQICFDVIGKELTISLASEAGQLELNVFEPIIFNALFDSLNYLKRGLRLLTEKTIKGLKLNEKRIAKNLNRSMAFATVFSTRYGYAEVSKIINNAIKNKVYIKDALIQGLNINEEIYAEIISKDNIIPFGKGK
jgi:aspartate ammonia-lyase